MTIEEKHHLNYETYQRNRRHMCWGAMVMMLICTAATVYDPESILMAQYLALSALVGAYFAVGHKEA